MTLQQAIVVCGTDATADADGGFPQDVTGVNSPYDRKRAILSSLGLGAGAVGAVGGRRAAGPEFVLVPVAEREPSLELARLAHDAGLVRYLETGWERWVQLGDRRCADFFHENAAGGSDSALAVPALVPANGTFRDAMQQPGESVHSQACYYHVDRFTPVFHGLLDALQSDLAVVRAASTAIDFPPLSSAPQPPVYALVTHPGHHATALSIGGFCYFNSAAILARLLQARARAAHSASASASAGAAARSACRIAIIDVDYHFGNGSASIFYDDPTVFVASIHADPETEYPFNCGHASQTGSGEGVGTTLCIPLSPQTTWSSAGEGGTESYEAALRRALAAVAAYGADALVVSLGVDAYCNDPVHLPRAGIKLQLSDFESIGELLAGAKLPTWLVQEGGYMLDVVGDAVRNVLCGILRTRGGDGQTAI